KTENMPEIFRTAKEWGFNRAFFMPMWASPTTEMNTKIRGTKSHPKLSKYAGWRFGNMCCPLAMDIAPDYGGWRGFRKIMTSAREAGLELYMWFGGHFSRHSTVPEARIWATDQCGQNQRNNYNGGLHVANIRDPRLFNYYFNNFKKCRDAGLAGLFRDGHFNLCVDTINYLPGPGTTKGGSPDQIGRLRHDPSPEDAFPLADIQDFHDAEAELQRKVQRELGMIYYVESAGILGMPMTGTYYKHLRGNEWLFQDVATHCSPKEAREHGMPYRLAYFRAMACRLSFNILMDPNEWKGPEKSRPRFLNDSFIAMIKGFGRVEDDLDVMHVLPGDRGIRWMTKDGKTETIFAYKAFDLDVPEGAKVTDVVADAPASVARGKARCKAMRIYQVAGV
ncbi:MAG: hypothetical protein QGD94_11190, partial [Planctomycetia bacterium]|nr:hypothetical protein [Planctomycetia bacterium]